MEETALLVLAVVVVGLFLAFLSPSVFVVETIPLVFSSFSSCRRAYYLEILRYFFS
jgi:predicted RND superfamily exporter protein